MKGVIKGILACGLFLLLTGGLLALAGWAMGGDIHALDSQVQRQISRMERAGWWPDREGDPIRSGGGREENLKLEPFYSLQIEADLADVTICQGEDYGISLYWWGRGYSFTHENRDGVLVVKSLPARTELERRGGSIQISLPDGAALEKGTLDVGMGDFQWEGVPLTDHFTANIGMGDIEIAGDLQGTWTTATGMGDVRVAAGAVEGLFEAETGMGDVQMTADTTAQLCRYQLSTGMGGVFVNGEEQQTGEIKGGEGQGNIALASGIGEVELELLG